MVAGSNPAAPTLEPYLKSPKSVNKNSSKTVNDNQFTATFLKRLSSVQVKLRLSDRALAKKLGISNAYLSYIKRGQREITSAFIQRASVLPGLESFAAEKSNISVSFCTYIEGMEIRGKPNIKHFIEDFLIAKRVEGKSPATLAFYRQNLERFCWWSEQNGVSQNIHRIQAQDLRSFLTYVQTTPKRWQLGSTSSVFWCGSLNLHIVLYSTFSLSLYSSSIPDYPLCRAPTQTKKGTSHRSYHSAVLVPSSSYISLPTTRVFLCSGRSTWLDLKSSPLLRICQYPVPCDCTIRHNVQPL